MRKLIYPAIFSFKFHHLVFVTLVTSLLACGGGSSDDLPQSNLAPTANAGSDQSVAEQVQVTLSGIASEDSDGNIVSYQWIQMGGSTVVLNDPGLVSVTFTTPVDSGGETLNFELVVTDNLGATGSDSIVISVDSVNPPSAGTYIENPDLDGEFRDAILVNRNPDCRAYAQDDNSGDYGSTQVFDISSNFADSESHVHIDMVIANNWNQDIFNYDVVIETTSPSQATHCRMVSNMIPNHSFGVQVTGPNGDGWINQIDHSDIEITYIPVAPVKTSTATNTPRNPPIFDFDGILLNGVGISMDSGFCYNPGVTTGPIYLQSNAAGNTSGCGPQNSWFELPAYTISEPSTENMAAVFDSYFAHGYEGTYHYHAMTHPLQEDNDQTHPPSNGMGSPAIGFAPDGFPIYGHWFVDQNNQLVTAISGYQVFAGNSRLANSDARHGTPPTPWDITNRPEDFESDFGLEMGRYEEDWYFAGSGNLDECNGAFDVNGDYGYYITDTYPFTPPCTFGVRDPSFGKTSPSLP